MTNIAGPTQVFAIDGATGMLRQTGVLPSATNSAVLAAHPSGRFLYFVGSDKISAYAVNPNGVVTPVLGSPFTAPGALNLAGITISPSGKFLVVSDMNNSGAWSYVVNTTTGALTLAPGSPFTTGISPFYLTINRGNKFVYISSQDGKITAYGIDPATAALTAVPGSPFSMSHGNSLAMGITLDQSGKFVYVEGKAGVDGYRINATTGALKLLAGSPFDNGGAGGGPMATDPLGAFIYGSSEAYGLTAYSINSTNGALTRLANTFSFGGGMMVPDTTGNYLYLPNGVAKVDRNTGALTAVMQMGNNSPWNIALVTGAAYVKFVPKFAYVANTTDSSISAYSVDPVSGALTNTGTFKTAAAPYSLATDPMGKYLYATNLTANTLSVYRINPQTGVLTQIQGSPYTTDQAPLTGTVSPSGNAIYVGTGTKMVNSFTVNSTNGQLTSTGSTDYGQQCGTPNALVMNPLGSYLYTLCREGHVSAAVPPSIEGGESLVVATVTDVMHPSGNNLYVAMFGTIIEQVPVSGFTFQPPNYTAFTDSNITSLALEPLGRFLYATEAGTVAGESIAINGEMSGIPGSPFTEGQQPVASKVDYSGKFLYVVNQDNTISGFTIYQTTGALTPMSSTFATGKGPSSIVLTGKFQ